MDKTDFSRRTHHSSREDAGWGARLATMSVSLSPAESGSMKPPRPRLAWHLKWSLTRPHGQRPTVARPLPVFSLLYSVYCLPVPQSVTTGLPSTAGDPETARGIPSRRRLRRCATCSAPSRSRQRRLRLPESHFCPGRKLLAVSRWLSLSRLDIAQKYGECLRFSGHNQPSLTRAS